MYYNDEYLQHFGIKGMKWGVRRYQNKDGSLTNAGKKRYSDNTEEENTDSKQSKEKRKLTRKQKVIMVGAAVVTAYATYKFVDSGSASRLIAKGKAALGHTSFDFNKNMNLAKSDMSSDEIMSNVVKRINPDYGKLGTKNNCRRCTFAYEMSRRGYDVKATKSISATGQSVVGLASATSDKGKSGLINYVKDAINDRGSVASRAVNFGNGLGTEKVYKRVDEKGYSKSIFKTLGEYKDGARGELTVQWSCGGGHSMAWEIVKGKPVIFDCQTGTKYDSSEIFEDIGSMVSKASVTRLDNIDLNNDFLMRWLKNA